MSKGYNMAGWRVGFCCGNAEMIRGLAMIKGYYDYGMFQAIQIAAIVALRHTEAAVERSRRCTGAGATSWSMVCAASVGKQLAQSRDVRVGSESPTSGGADEYDGLRHDAAGEGRCGRQPGQRFWRGGRGLSANGAGGKRKPAAAGGAADRRAACRRRHAWMRLGTTASWRRAQTDLTLATRHAAGGSRRAPIHTSGTSDAISPAVAPDLAERRTDPLEQSSSDPHVAAIALLARRQGSRGADGSAGKCPPGPAATASGRAVTALGVLPLVQLAGC